MSKVHMNKKAANPAGNLAIMNRQGIDAPPGYVSVYHETTAEALESINTSGLTAFSEARNIGGASEVGALNELFDQDRPERLIALGVSRVHNTFAYFSLEFGFSLGFAAQRYVHRSQAMLEQLTHERVEAMTQVALQASGRIDEEGYIQPIEVKRTLQDGQSIIGEPRDSVWRTDIFVPTKEETRGYIETDANGITTKNRVKNPRLDQILYRNLAGKEMQHLTEEQAAAIHHDKTTFEATISGLPGYELYYSGYVEGQLDDAYHVTAIEKPEPDFAPTRVYVPGGVDALKVANAVLASGADVRHAKVWTPEVNTSEQYVRQDAPIFEVTTFEQLGSLMTSLRNLAKEGKLPAGKTPLAGYEVEGLPGVYVGQAEAGTSFNGRMRDLFGKSIQEACSQIRMHAGEVVTTDTISNIALHARELAQANATETHTDPYNHAFLSGQPVDAILAVVNQN